MYCKILYIHSDQNIVWISFLCWLHLLIFFLGSTAYKQTQNSFLFSLRNKDNLEPFKSPVYKNREKAIYQNPNYGPTFGGGHDVYIVNNAGSSLSSYSNFGYTYKPPNGYVYGNAKTKALLAGAYNFQPTEIEVYYLP